MGADSMHRQLITKAVSIAVIGPNSLFRECLRGAFHAPYRAEIVSETIESLPGFSQVDLVVLIVDRDNAALLALVRRVKHGNPSGRLVVLSDVGRSGPAWPLIAAGVDGCLPMGISSDALHVSLAVVMLGGTVVHCPPSDAFANPRAERREHDKAVATVQEPMDGSEVECRRLSGRETEIVLCLRQGESNKHIARKFEIAEATVKVHLKAILRKIRVSNRTQAAMWAHANYPA